MEEKYFKEEEQEAVKNSLFQTKNVSNNPFDLNKLSGRQTFCKEERLKRAVLIDKLFNEGKALHSNNLTLIFLPLSLDSIYPAQCTFSVPKKNFKSAVSRNTLKRRMREAYRKNKILLYQTLAAKNTQLALGWIFRSKKESDFNVIEQDMLVAIEKLQKLI
jgi:ribonuclease P protein component